LSTVVDLNERVAKSRLRLSLPCAARLNAGGLSSSTRMEAAQECDYVAARARKKTDQRKNNEWSRKVDQWPYLASCLVCGWGVSLSPWDNKGRYWAEL
jgi:hypothetical protein